jgi:hypothetical protein
MRDRAMTPQHTPPAAVTPAGGRLQRLWSSVTGGIGAVTGLVPHLLHHIGPLAGTALVAGAGGTLLFGTLGLLASVPLLLRLHRRFANWWAPATALAVFAAMFSLSAFVIGPAISGNSTDAPAPGTPVPATTEHSEHHTD